jgi:hypothetical protein
MMTTQPERVLSVELTSDEALVLFEFLHRFADTGALTVADQAEERALWNLSASLERVLVAPFASNYEQLLKGARDRLRDDGV